MFLVATHSHTPKDDPYLISSKSVHWFRKPPLGVGGEGRGWGAKGESYIGFGRYHTIIFFKPGNKMLISSQIIANIKNFKITENHPTPPRGWGGWVGQKGERGTLWAPSNIFFKLGDKFFITFKVIAKFKFYWYKNRDPPRGGLRGGSQNLSSLNYEDHHYKPTHQIW